MESVERPKFNTKIDLYTAVLAGNMNPRVQYAFGSMHDRVYSSEIHWPQGCQNSRKYGSMRCTPGNQITTLAYGRLRPERKPQKGSGRGLWCTAASES
jgi:hypothetical protein